MFVKKKSICELEKCYSIAPFQQNGEPRFLVRRKSTRRAICSVRMARSWRLYGPNPAAS